MNPFKLLLINPSSPLHSISLLFFSSVFLFFILLPSFASSNVARRAYLIHVIPHDHDEVEAYHKSFLPELTTLQSEAGYGTPELMYSYSEVFSGFAAKLTEEELENVKKKDGYVNVYPEEIIPLATTHSPDFLGLRTGGSSWPESGLWTGSGQGQGVIIGMLDTGILPSHPSFNDQGLSPPPKRWKGTCEFRNGGCNNKIIGARAFGSAMVNISAPPLDDAGHGTHTASTAAGNFVIDANFKGNANGTAAGMAPHAHLAMYKVCTRGRCSNIDVLAGLDAAVKDRVDILSFSLGLSTGSFRYDAVATATFKAMEKGVFVSCAAGNSGPIIGSVSNVYPWVLTVGAGTMDRAIRSTVKLGNGLEFDGESLFQPVNYSSALLPLVYPAKNFSLDPDCDSLDRFDIKGKIVICRSPGSGGRTDIGSQVLGSGGAGLILVNRKSDGYTTFADLHVLPASHISYNAGNAILSYIKSTTHASATFVFKGTVIGSSPSQTVTSFSSRGPSKTVPSILKPDITGPGMNILAAWAPTFMQPFVQPFYMDSGTSMSTPHLSGIAALIKSEHQDWSPAMIKSAIMTTSDNKDRSGTPIYDEQYQKASVFAMGAGYVNPSRAVDPGLVYDVTTEDYMSYLCGSGLGDEGVSAVVHRNVSCSVVGSMKGEELNYPAIIVNLQSGPVTVNRTVINVGKASEKYKVVIDMPKEVKVVVKPKQLHFSAVNEKKSFSVTIISENTNSGAEGNLKWVSKDHDVRSPLVVVAES